MAENCSAVPPSSSASDSPTDPELELNEANVISWLEDFPRSKWGDLGIVLKVSHSKLDEIRANNPRDVSRCFTEVIINWLRNSKVSWKALWEALYEHSVAQENLGKKIRDWYTRKMWNDPRQGASLPRGTYIQLLGEDKRLKAVEYSVGDTGLNKNPEPGGYFRVEPVIRRPLTDSIISSQLKNIKRRMSEHLKIIQPDQKRFKVGYEARFGQLYWIINDDRDKSGDVHSFSKYSPTRPQIFSTHITSDIERLTERKCHPPSKEHESWLVDPLKFVVDLPSHRDVIYVAVISQVEDVFVLHEVYQKQPKQLNSTFDIVLPQRKYDIRVGDCCALMVEAEDDRVRQIAERITRSIHKSGDGTLSMQLAGKDFHVKFFRHKKQQIYRWKGKEKERWYLAEYDIDTFEMNETDELYKTLKADASQGKDCVVPVEFNGGHKKEVELWSRTFFPEGYSSSHPTSRMYIDPEATGIVRMPNTAAQPPTTWTTEELMKDFDEFVQAAFDVTGYLEVARALPSD